MCSNASDNNDDLPPAIADWLDAHPIKQGRQFGPLPPGWTDPILEALEALNRSGAEVLLCKFKLGSMRLRVRPEDLVPPLHASWNEEIISRAQNDCLGRCTLCGQRLPKVIEDMDGARCLGCKAK